MVDREAVLANAKYLRNVRPVDPEEIHEYVDGQPHPAVVRRVLREEAVDLGLREREDGTFVPASEAPAPPPTLPVAEFPERYARRLEDLLVEAYGPDWHRGESGDALRERLRHLKRAYHRGWGVEYDEEAALAYAIYHLPDYYAAIQYVLAELAEVELLSRTLRVLDVGAGVGGPALGVADALPDDALVQYDAVEPGAGADVLEAMLEETGRNVHAAVHRTTAEAFDCVDAAADGARSRYDLVLFGNVLSELDDPVATARRYADAVADDGALLLLSPADRHTTRTLRIVERALADGRVPDDYEGETDVEQIETDVDESETDADQTETGATDADAGADDSDTGTDDADAGADDSDAGTDDAGTGADDTGSGAAPETDALTVFSPTVRLWPNHAPSDEGWSFVVRPDLDVPPFQRRLDEPVGAEGEFVNVDVQYSYATLRRDGEWRVTFAPDRSRWASLAESERHVSERVDCVAIKLSADLADDGHPLFRIGDGSEAVDHFAVLTKETGLNEALREAAYGDLLTFESVLVLWNDDEGAYNFVVDDETVVERAPAPVRY